MWYSQESLDLSDDQHSRHMKRESFRITELQIQSEMGYMKDVMTASLPALLVQTLASEKASRFGCQNPSLPTDKKPWMDVLCRSGLVWLKGPDVNSDARCMHEGHGLEIASPPFLVEVMMFPKQRILWTASDSLRDHHQISYIDLLDDTPWILDLAYHLHTTGWCPPQQQSRKRGFES